MHSTYTQFTPSKEATKFTKWNRERKRERKWKSKLNASIVQKTVRFSDEVSNTFFQTHFSKVHCKKETISLKLLSSSHNHFSNTMCSNVAIVFVPFTLSWNAEFAYVSIWQCQLVSGRRTSIPIFSQCTTAIRTHFGMAQFTISFAFPIPIARIASPLALGSAINVQITGITFKWKP